MKESEKTDFFTITINIFEGQPLKMEIPRDEEETYRQAATWVNALIKKCREARQTATHDTLLAMSLMIFAVQRLRDSKKIELLQKEIDAINAALNA
ncbi:MAG: cell division protein ZapA [Prevotellaceae bacterium]|jgi:cell division protein ZapA (FtsZ GTPase activity inhibitor)|nr:cell division protein ZapA [Prevotellaceae bacterium]